MVKPYMLDYSGVNWVRASLALGTIVRIGLVSDAPRQGLEAAQRSAFEAIRVVESACSGLDADSELNRLIQSPIGRPVAVGPILYQVVRFACEVAKWTDGRCDLTVDENSGGPGLVRQDPANDGSAGYRDIECDDGSRTICLHRPLLPDLVAAAKGLAVDRAVQSLREHELDGFVVDAGDDLYVGGLDARKRPWTVGVRHPLRPGALICTVKVSDVSVCTSGGSVPGSPVRVHAHPVVKGGRGPSKEGILSVTAVGTSAMTADAFSAAALASDPRTVRDLLDGAGLGGIVTTRSLEIFLTGEMGRYRYES